MRGLEGLGIGTQTVDDAAELRTDLVDRIPAHGAGGIDKEVDGETSSGTHETLGCICDYPLRPLAVKRMDFLCGYKYPENSQGLGPATFWAPCTHANTPGLGTAKFSLKNRRLQGSASPSGEKRRQRRGAVSCPAMMRTSTTTVPNVSLFPSLSTCVERDMWFVRMAFPSFSSKLAIAAG